MDPSQIAAHAKVRFAHEAAKRQLREKYEAKMIFAHGGGLWKAGPDLQMLLMSCQDTVAVILDLYGVPIKVDVKEMRDLSNQRWQEQMNAWLVEHETLCALR